MEIDGDYVLVTYEHEEEDEVGTYTNENSISFRLPKSATRFIEKFDEGVEVKPTQFKIKVSKEDVKNLKLKKKYLVATAGKAKKAKAGKA